MNVTSHLKCITILQLVTSICSIYVRVDAKYYKDDKDNALVTEVGLALVTAVALISTIICSSNYFGGNNKILLGAFGHIVPLTWVQSLFTVLFLVHKYSDNTNTWMGYCACICGLTTGITVIVLSGVFIWRLALAIKEQERREAAKDHRSF